MFQPHASPSDALAPWIEQRARRWSDGRTDELLKANALQGLAAAMRQLLDAIDRLDFSTLLQPMGWWRRLTGEHVLNEVRYRVADRELGQLMAAAQACADRQLAWHERWQVVAQEHREFVRGLAQRIAIEERILSTQEPAGPDSQDDAAARAIQLQNARLVLASAQLTAQQFKLLQGRHDTALARFADIKLKLMPMWLDQLTAVIHGRALQAEHLRAAMQTYATLSQKLRTDLPPQNKESP